MKFLEKNAPENDIGLSFLSSFLHLYFLPSHLFIPTAYKTGKKCFNESVVLCHFCTTCTNSWIDKAKLMSLDKMCKFIETRCELFCKNLVQIITVGTDAKSLFSMQKVYRSSKIFLTASFKVM